MEQAASPKRYRLFLMETRYLKTSSGLGWFECLDLCLESSLYETLDFRSYLHKRFHILLPEKRYHSVHLQKPLLSGLLRYLTKTVLLNRIQHHRQHRRTLPENSNFKIALSAADTGHSSSVCRFLRSGL